ncbi:helix-turn-helix domain-containing protein [Allorhizobium borbori]|uniref:CRP/FNR family transcriptional regulator n=1 Tax=Allorhizobium borbori TaxID=485907 RepID=A0A7W6K0T4_9HYPH|nr:helix-turn-helix domain-containing protein [Allorhizobium borbori]MBB4103095.1 CRP/FNR family transcriptional regulator [Allorhizobium borbori]
MLSVPFAGLPTTDIPKGISAQFGKPGTFYAKSVSLTPRAGLSHASGPSFLEIVEGCVALYRSLSDGRRQILDILGPGRILGPGIADAHACSSITITHTRLEPVTADWRNADRIAAEIRIMLQRSMDHAILLGRKTARERVATALLDLAAQFAKPSIRPTRAIGFILYLTRADLADWLGLTLETVSRCLNRFKRSGLIDFRSPELVSITDPNGLSALAAGQEHSGSNYSSPKGSRR